MKVSRDGLALTRAFESCWRPVKDRPGFFAAYRCPAGVLTIGWGHTNAAGTRPFTADTVWSQHECDEVLSIDKRKFEARVLRAVAPAPLTQHQFDALISFDFNTGGILKSSIPARLKAGKAHEVPALLNRWTKARGQVMPGLVRRRMAEAALFEGRVADAHRIAGIVVGREPDTARRVDRPRPPASDVAKRAAKPAAAIVGAGGVGAGTTQIAPASDPAQTVSPSTLALAGAGFVIVVALAVAFLRIRRLNRDWA